MSLLKSVFIAVVFPVCCTGFAKDGENYELSKEGVSSAVIVISDKPVKSAQFAAHELHYHLEKMTGGSFEIVEEGTKNLSDDLVRIYVGETNASKSAGFGNDSFTAQEYTVSFSGKSIFLTGRDAQDFSKVAYDMNNLPASGNWPEFFRMKSIAKLAALNKPWTMMQARRLSVHS